MKKALFFILSTITLISCDTKIADMLAIMERGSIICVDPGAISGSNTGESWENAFTTIQAAVNAADSGDEIWLAGSYTGAQAISTINKEVTIVGGFTGIEESKRERDSGRYTNINNSGTIFTITSIATFQQIKISNNPAVSSSFFSMSGNANVYIYNCKFNNNSDSGGIGQLVFTVAANTELHLSDCEFINNAAGSSGGILVSSLNNKISVNNCYFENNSASGSGGVFHLPGVTDLEIYNSKFLGNYSTTNGGVINSISSNTITISNNCFFEGNGIDQSGTVQTDNGGVIYGSAADSIINISDNCLFKSNSCKTAGGVLYLNNGISLSISDNCEFYYNFIKGINSIGAVIYSGITGLSDISIQNNCSFVQNYVSADDSAAGGVLYLNMSNIDISGNCVFRNNYALSTNGPLCEGGAIDIVSSPSVYISNGCSFENNYCYSSGSDAYGGAISFNTCPDIDIRNNNFMGNTAKTSGNAIYNISSTLNPDILTVNIFGPNDDIYP